MVITQVNEGIKQLQVFQQIPTSIARNLEQRSSDPQTPSGFYLVQFARENKIKMTNSVLQVDGSWEKKSKRARWGWVFKHGDQNHYQ